MAVANRDAEMTALLLQKKADPMQKNSSGMTPQQLAESTNSDGSQINVLAVLAASF